jgi:S1-C subfamily serine protease
MIATQSRVVHGWLGVVGTDAIHGAIHGAGVVETLAEGPAAVAGLKPGDLVVGMLTAGVMEPILSMSDLEGRLYLEPPGAKVELEVVRGEEVLTLAPVLAASKP